MIVCSVILCSRVTRAGGAVGWECGMLRRGLRMLWGWSYGDGAMGTELWGCNGWYGMRCGIVEVTCVSGTVSLFIMTAKLAVWACRPRLTFQAIMVHHRALLA